MNHDIINLAVVSYTNSLPFIEGFKQSKYIQETTKVHTYWPSKCVEKVVTNECQIGLLPIFSSFKNPSLQRISSSIQNLKKLRYLDLWSNDFYAIPPEIGTLPELKKVDLRMLNFSDTKQKLIQSYLPKTIIYFSQGCDCD